MAPQFYRNKIMLKDIEPGALWERQDNVMVLVDEDQHVTFTYHDDIFEEAPKI